MKLKDLSFDSVPLYHRYLEFNLVTHFVTDFYWRYLMDVSHNNIKKIAIRIFPSKPKMEIFEAMGVLCVNRQYNLDSFFSSSEYEQTHFLSKFILDSVKLIGNKQLDEACLYAHKEFIANNCTNNFVYKDIVYSKDKKFYGLIICEHTPSVFRIKANVYTSDGLPVQQCVLQECEPYSIVYMKYLGKVKWENGIALYSADGKQKLFCDFNGL